MSWINGPGRRVTIPKRLLPYLDDLLRHGLFGTSFREVVIRCVERDVQEQVKKGHIPMRVKGKVHRGPA